MSNVVETLIRKHSNDAQVNTNMKIKLCVHMKQYITLPIFVQMFNKLGE